MSFHVYVHLEEDVVNLEEGGARAGVEPRGDAFQAVVIVLAGAINV